jgi:hypothetical protein
MHRRSCSGGAALQRRHLWVELSPNLMEKTMTDDTRYKELMTLLDHARDDADDDLLLMLEQEMDQWGFGFHEKTGARQ